MSKENLKILSSYCLGLIVSIFLTLALGKLWDVARILFSAITASATIYFMYSDMWKFGKRDKLTNTASITRPFLYTLFFTIICALIAIAMAVCKLAGAPVAQGYIMMAGVIWFYPFNGFFVDSMFLPTIPIITVITLLFCVLGYYMGAKGISFLDKYSEWKAGIAKKAQIKHEEEIEKIKEQYR